MPLPFAAYDAAAAVCDAAILEQPLPACAASAARLPPPLLVSIFRSRYGAFVRATAHVHRGPSACAALAAARAAPGGSVLSHARAVGAPPAALARLALAQSLGLPGGARVPLAAALRGEPAAQPRAAGGGVDAALAAELAAACAADAACAPARDALRASVGAAHEALLRAALRGRRIPHADEGALRRAGYAKTPDVKLDVPLGVRDAARGGAPRVIHWIDSKATFGDPAAQREAAAQLRGYCNRFGPGLVIFWGGAVQPQPLAGAHAPAPLLPADVVVAEALFDEWLLPGDAAVRRAPPGEAEALRAAAADAADAAARARAGDAEAADAEAAAVAAAAPAVARCLPCGALAPRHVARLYADAGLLPWLAAGGAMAELPQAVREALALSDG